MSTGTPFLSTADIAHILQWRGLGPCLRGLMETLRADFMRWEDFDKSARVAHHSPVGVIELMPISDGRTYAFKYVNGHPGNTALGLSTVMAFGGLASVTTGEPQLISELTLCTALRTAATSVLAASVLARPDSQCMALIGNGAQSEFQALAFAHLLGIRQVRLFDRDPGATAKLVAHLRGSGLQIEVCHSTRHAVDGADIVTTITADKTAATIITPDMLQPGMHLNAVGGDCPGKTELHPDVLRAARVFVEYEPQTRHEGDLQQMPDSFAVTELWQVLRGLQAGRQHREDITVFDSVGFALEDYSVLRYMHAAAQALGIGQTLALVPVLSDPKDLYSLLMAAPPAPQPATLDWIEDLEEVTG